MNTDLFDYHLPAERIAAHSIEPRDAARLLVLDRETGVLADRHVFDLPSLLRPGDLLVFNDSKVFKARLIARLLEKEVEIFLLRPVELGWLALAKPAKKLSIGSELVLPDGTVATVIEKDAAEGTVTIDFHRTTDEVFLLSDQFGEVPLPPYVPTSTEATANYQTVYAKERGSVAAPTAGFHFTSTLLDTLDKQGIDRAFVTLHVGIGTFRPMKTETLEAHRMHEEWASVSEETVRKIRETKAGGGRVVAVGTTTVRALESAAATHGQLEVFSGFTSLFITPGFPFKVIDGLVTNFHLPKSTLLVLVSSLAGRENILKAYKHAVDNDYRFYSFGDAMFIASF